MFKGLIKKETAYKILVIVLFVVILLSVLYFCTNTFDLLFNSPSRKGADNEMAKNIERSINKYINESKDYNLTFGENSKPNVETIINGIQTQSTVSGTKYGPYMESRLENGETLKEANYYLQWTPKYGGKNVGWEITVYKSKLKATVEPSATGNELIFKD